MLMQLQKIVAQADETDWLTHLYLVGCFFLLLAVPPLRAEEAAGTSLFDGKSFEGWVLPSGPDAGNFTIRDGLIHIEGGSGWVHTVKKYSNFTLKAVVRFTSADGSGNSGIFVRSTDTSTFARGWPGKSFEVETRDMNVNAGLSPPWAGQILRLPSGPARAPEGLASFDSAAAKRAYKKTGEWNTFEVVAHDDRVWVFVNGEHLSTVDNVANADGYIGLQSETGVIEFKSLDIVEHPLAAGPAQYVSLFDGKELNGWTVDKAQHAGNFSVRDGVLHIEGEGGWLRSRRQYSDFVLRFEFRILADNAVSGVFLRTPASGTFENGWPADSVEVRLRNLANPPGVVGDPRWPGAILRNASTEGTSFFDSAAAIRANKGKEQWQLCEIEARGEELNVKLNGIPVSRALDVPHARGGYLGFRAGAGAIEIRSIEIIDRMGEGR
jgi:hypothetical protein